VRRGGGEAYTSERVGRQLEEVPYVRRARGGSGSPPPSPGARLGCPWRQAASTSSRSWSGGAGRAQVALPPTACRAGSPPYAESSPSRPLRALEACHAPLPSSPPETLGCEDIRFVVVLGSDPCDLQIGREGVEGETTFRTPRGVAAAHWRPGARDDARFALEKESEKDHAPLWGLWGGVGGGDLNKLPLQKLLPPTGRERPSSLPIALSIACLSWWAG
jgi:hypothetical protein